jgi:uncharacterized protein
MSDLDRIQQAQRRGLSNRRLKLTIYGSDRCNMRCPYCYQDHRGSHLTNDTAAGIVAFIDRRAAHLAFLELGFFGGEPLLAADNILRIMRGVQPAVRAHGVRLTASITTNAVLLEPRLDEILAAGVGGFQITLEGLAHVHDQTRIGPDRKPTFAVVWSALAALKNHAGAHVTTIRVHYRAETAGELPELVSRVGEAFLDDPRFRVLLFPVSAWGSKQDGWLKRLTKAEKAWIEGTALSVLPPQRRVRAMGANLETREAPSACYAAEANAFTISPTGRIGKCTVMTDDRNAVGQLTADGRLLIDHDRHAPWLQGLVEGDWERMSCPARRLWAKPAPAAPVEAAAQPA